MSILFSFIYLFINYILCTVQYNSDTKTIFNKEIGYIMIFSFSCSFYQWKFMDVESRGINSFYNSICLKYNARNNTLTYIPDHSLNVGHNHLFKKYLCF